MLASACLQTQLPWNIPPQHIWQVMRRQQLTSSAYDAVTSPAGVGLLHPFLSAGLTAESYSLFSSPTLDAAQVQASLASTSRGMSSLGEEKKALRKQTRQALHSVDLKALRQQSLSFCLLLPRAVCALTTTSVYHRSHKEMLRRAYSE